MEVSKELTTPRGIPSVHCEILDSKLDEGLDRPSPISVLDANTFDEELSPSPSSPRHSFPVLQGQYHSHIYMYITMTNLNHMFTSQSELTCKARFL
jgi:hypothetical protein